MLFSFSFSLYCQSLSKGGKNTLKTMTFVGVLAAGNEDCTEQELHAVIIVKSSSDTAAVQVHWK